MGGRGSRPEGRARQRLVRSKTRSVAEILLAGLDAEGEAVLRRRERAGRVAREGARRAVGAVEVERDAAVGAGRVGVEVAPRAVGLLAARLVGEDDEELLAPLLPERLQPVLAPPGLEGERARRRLLGLHPEDVEDGHAPRRGVRLEARADDPLHVRRVVVRPLELGARGVLAVTD